MMTVSEALKIADTFDGPPEVLLLRPLGYQALVVLAAAIRGDDSDEPELEDRLCIACAALAPLRCMNYRAESPQTLESAAEQPAPTRAACDTTSTPGGGSNEPGTCVHDWVPGHRPAPGHRNYFFHRCSKCGKERKWTAKVDAEIEAERRDNKS